MSEHQYGFLSAELDNVRPGSVKLRAPTLNNIIQIDLVDSDGHAELHVQRDKHGIHIVRTDGEPLQVEVNHVNAKKRKPHLSRHRRLPVFERPVPSVSFAKREFHETVLVPANMTPQEAVNPTLEWHTDWIGWLACGEGVKVTDNTQVKHFADAMGKYVFTKQQATYPSLRLKKWFGSFRIRHGFYDPDEF